ncbi:MAG: hypothetical protein DLM69_07460 [Candidatus Chloroheliales bacterium]|nr:MAG: hypothetical protein DLM69_07460 [Chloroflexota bacterium]
MTLFLEHSEAADLLAAYVAGTLTEAERKVVAAHIGVCPSCEQSVAQWAAVRDAVRVAAPTSAPHPQVLERIHKLIAPASASLQLGFVWQLLLAQLPLVRRQIWAASALVMGLGVAVALTFERGSGTVLALLAPIVAAAGIGFIYGPDNDPPLELVLATPTSPRLVLLTRLSLVFGYNLLLALLLSALVTVLGQAPAGLLQLVWRWLGPMLLLSAISLALSLRFGSAPGVAAALSLWAVSVGLLNQIDQPNVPAAQALTLLGSTNLLTLLLAMVIGTAVVIWLPHQECLA